MQHPRWVRLWWVSALCVSSAAHAQAPHTLSADPQQASGLPDWSAARPAVGAHATSPELPLSLDEAIRRWQAANRSVAEFPRGHIDLLRWENANVVSSPSTPTAQDLDWPTVWSAVQANHASDIVGPRANALERQQAQRRWLSLERQARHAWVQATTAQALLRLQQERLAAAHTAHTLGERMVALGHWSRARLVPVQQDLAQEQATLVAATAQARQSLEALALTMGLWRHSEVNALAGRLPDALPQPPAVAATEQAEALVLTQKQDLAWQREAADLALRSVSERTWNTWLREREAALANQRQGQPPQWPASALRSDHALEKAVQAQASLQRQASELRSLVRQAWDQLQASVALDELHQQRLVPLAQTAENETLLRYNGMLQSTWEVIDAARARLGAQADALRARQAHWQAHTDWHTLLAGGDIDAPAGVSTGTSAASRSAAKGH